MGTRRVFGHFVWLEVGSVKVALSRPAHQRVSREDHTGQAANRWATEFGYNHAFEVYLLRVYLLSKR